VSYTLRSGLLLLTPAVGVEELVAISGLIAMPPIPAYGAALPATSSIAMTGAAHKAAVIFQAPKAGPLDGVAWLNGTNGTTSWTMRVSFQDLDSSGNPDGGVDQFSSVGIPTPLAWNTSGAITSDGTAGGTKRTVTQGERLAAVWDFSAYTSGTTNLLEFSTTGLDNPLFPYNAGYTTSWAKNNLTSAFALRYADGSYPPLGPPAQCLPASTSATVAWNSGTTPDEYGLYMLLPFSVQVVGMWMSSTFTAGGDIEIVVYEGTTQLTRNLVPAAATTAGTHTLIHRFPETLTLTANTVYRMTVAPTTTTNISGSEYTFASATIRSAYDCGAYFSRTERTNLGAFTETATKLPVMGLLIGAIAGEPNGGGGGAAEAGTGGRLNRGIN
jgi:hypothetical protein